MIVLKTVSDFRKWRSPKVSLGLVPTMGALHEGHFSLVRKSLQENHSTVVSIFVNSTQFNSSEDLENYPRTLEQDISSLESLGVNAIFTPSHKEMYPNDYSVKVTETEDSLPLCGGSRPGHFDGVLSVVLKLFMISGCQRSYFGEKDFQQLHLVKKMVQSFFLPVEVIGVPTVREESGLALSSRNKLLSKAQKEKATMVHHLLESDTPVAEARRKLELEGFKVDYLEERWGRKFAAAHIGNVRLIDNV